MLGRYNTIRPETTCTVTELCFAFLSLSPSLFFLFPQDCRKRGTRNKSIKVQSSESLRSNEIQAQPSGRTTKPESREISASLRFQFLERTLLLAAFTALTRTCYRIGNRVCVVPRMVGAQSVYVNIQTHRHTHTVSPLSRLIRGFRNKYH